MFTVCLLFLALIISYGHGESFTRFDGSTYVTYSYKEEQRTLPDNIRLLFRTIKPSGILLHATSSGGDFITLELLRGKIRYSIFGGSMRNLTSGIVTSRNLENAVVDLADNEWHQVDLEKETTDSLVLYVDITKEVIKVPRFYSRTFGDQTIYLAGVDVGRINSRQPLLSNRDFIPFEGCLDDAHVAINGLMLHNFTRRGNKTLRGRHLYECNGTTEYDPITFKKPESFMKVNVASVDAVKYSLKFRTHDGEGILLFERITKANGARIIVSLVGGTITLRVTFAKKESPVILHGGSNLEDGMWHSVSVDISIRRVILEVDSDISSSQSSSSQGTFLSSSEVYVGANNQGKLGFVGCMRDFMVRGQKLNLTDVYKSQIGEIDKCSLSDLCIPNPCLNGGRCSQARNKTICHCAATDFKGPKCETPAFFMQTCADWWIAGKRSNGYYKINPWHSKPFSVYCNMSNVEGPSTVIFHTQDRIRVKAAKNKNGGRYRHDIKYETTNTRNINYLIASSTHCRQYLAYHCYNSILFDSPKEFILKSGRGARWLSRDGKIQDYWSGAARGSMKCACGMNQTCVERSKSCNCDTLDNTWHDDSGYLTDVTSLPVKSLIFSVDGTNPESRYVLGSLECYGSTTKRTTTTSFPASDTLVTPQPSTKSQTKSPSTIVSTAYKPPISKEDRKRASTTKKAPFSSKTSTGASEVNSQATPESTDDSVDIVVIETPKKYITIRENANQELVLIILSVILSIFVIAIIVLVIKQNLFFPCKCKCLKAPLYHDVRHMDVIELGPPSEAEPEPILQFEASPYPTRNYDIGSSHDCHRTSSPELYSDAETDRLDISNGSSSWISENADVGKDKPEKNTGYEDIDLGLIDLRPSLNARKQLSTEEKFKKLKEVILDVLSASDVRANFSDKKENPVSPVKPKDVHLRESSFEFSQSHLPVNEQLLDSDNDSTATVSELSSDQELFYGDQCAENYPCDKETPCNHDVCDESSKENTLVIYKPSGERRISRNNWISSDPHDNYLSLDVNNLEDDTLEAQPLSSTLSGYDYKERTPTEIDVMSPSAENENYRPTSCDGGGHEVIFHRDDKCKHSSPRSRLFSRQKSEEEALLPSKQANETQEQGSDRLPENFQRHYSGFSNSFYRQPHQQQNASARKSQPENGHTKERRKNSPKQGHSQKYETEL
ncbi:contactin-associated protein-like 5 [Stylophora pistillata]|uniref:Contactin-associated protein-like 5 n=1 Tax=Stylophora pistillata TaxID=50429 RepID=A0A2B4S4W9_STYPI|nr:contactin-associated protein-like 5 [Stylophora pistillata]XP_022794096.1 contactin-associated protein-like 5 [Stylophora pistillata]PFX23515.1 Contactin-associated protein-like 5 [Stylophora pistillata]